MWLHQNLSDYFVTAIEVAIAYIMHIVAAYAIPVVKIIHLKVSIVQISVIIRKIEVLSTVLRVDHWVNDMCKIVSIFGSSERN